MTDEPCITELDATSNSPSGHRVTKSVTDLRGERRTITRTVRGEDSLQRAIEIRDEINRKKDSAQWLRRTFSAPKKERRKKNLLGHISDSDDPEVIYTPENDEPEDPAEKLRSMTLRGWVEAGVHEDPDHPDSVCGYVPTEDPDFRGWIREAFDRLSHSTLTARICPWKHIKRWGALNDKAPSAATTEHLRSLRDYLEDAPRVSSKTTIKNYVEKLREICNQWAKRTGSRKPLTDSLDSSRIRGSEPKKKVVSTGKLHRLRDAFRQRAEGPKTSRYPRRLMVWSIFRVHSLTGMRSGELLGLQESDIDRSSQTVHIQRAISSEREEVPIKEIRMSGDRTRTKTIPLLDPAVTAIDEWMEIREEHGWPPASEQPLIFCREDGKPWTPRELYAHYRLTSEAAGFDEVVSPHRVRHSVNDLLREAGVPIDIRRAVLGHASDEVNRGYTNPRPDEAVDGLKRLAETLQLKSS